MTDQDRLSAVETALRAACVEARRVGLTLVRGAAVVMGGGPLFRRPIGCCAWGAHGLTHDELGDIDVEVSAPEYDAIEHGWDGERAVAERDGLPMDWYAVGERLASEFQPVPASTLEAG